LILSLFPLLYPLCTYSLVLLSQVFSVFSPRFLFRFFLWFVFFAPPLSVSLCILSVYSLLLWLCVRPSSFFSFIFFSLSTCYWVFLFSLVFLLFCSLVLGSLLSYFLCLSSVFLLFISLSLYWFLSLWFSVFVALVLPWVLIAFSFFLCPLLSVPPIPCGLL